MTVYVDDMRASFGRMIMCHMIADTELELHVMAGRIGIARRWYQRNHYDIALSKRAAAVQLGAREITQRQCACMVALQMRGNAMPAPEVAIERYKLVMRAERIRPKGKSVLNKLVRR